jgi:hypothetical protein
VDDVLADVALIYVDIVVGLSPEPVVWRQVRISGAYFASVFMLGSI